MVKARMSVRGPTRGSFISVEGQYLSSRGTLAGVDTAPATVVNLTVTQPLARSLELVGTVKNMFDDEYDDPASAQHRQNVIPQNGRTARIGVRWRPWVK
jgi:outer membrane receptor protein involved in Fe transport